MLAPEELIVSKTDPKGLLTYVNDTFVRISGFAEAELLGRPHNVVRHPDMPRGVFGFMWEVLFSGQEMFAYIVNRCADGGHYWVLAHVTPTYDGHGRLLGYHSNRRAPSRAAVREAAAVYRRVCSAEALVSGGARAATEAGRRELDAVLAERGESYDDFVWGLIGLEDAA